MMGGKMSMPEPKEPTWYDTEIWENGTLKAKQHKVGNTIKQENIHTPEEQALTKRREEGITYYTKEIPKFEEKLNVFDPNWLAEIQQQGKTYQEGQTTKFNDEYTPAYNDLVEESVKKFGTTNSSWFMDELSKLEKIKQQTYKDISSEATQKETDFKQTELTNRQNFLDNMRKSQSALQQGQNDFDAKQAQKLQANAELGEKASDITNNYNASIYNTRMQGYVAQQQMRRSLLSSMFGGIGSIFGGMR
jgi:uncharacterized protein with von Willebrand factor type A (vWA) domain